MPRGRAITAGGERRDGNGCWSPPVRPRRPRVIVGSAGAWSEEALLLDSFAERDYQNGVGGRMSD